MKIKVCLLLVNSLTFSKCIDIKKMWYKGQGVEILSPIFVNRAKVYCITLHKDKLSSMPLQEKQGYVSGVLKQPVFFS